MTEGLESGKILEFKRPGEKAEHGEALEQERRRERLAKAGIIIAKFSPKYQKAEAGRIDEILPETGVDGLENVLDKYEEQPGIYDEFFVYKVAREYVERFKESPVVSGGFKNVVSLEEEREWRNAEGLLQSAEKAFNELETYVESHRAKGVQESGIEAMVNKYRGFTRRELNQEVRVALEIGLRGIENNPRALEDLMGLYMAFLGKLP